MAHRIIPRSEWGARHAGGFHDRPVGSLRRYLHHSVTIAPDLVPPFTDDYAAVRELEAIGQSRFKGGISYTFAITPAGLVFEGHGIDRVGAHTAGYNTISAGICLIGNYEKDQPTPAQLAALDWLLHEGVRRSWWTSPTLTGGHRDTKSTACPGINAYRLIPAVNAGKYHDITPEKEEGFLMAFDEKDAQSVLWNVRQIKKQLDELSPVLWNVRQIKDLVDEAAPVEVEVDANDVADALLERLPKETAQAVLDALNARLAK